MAYNFLVKQPTLLRHRNSSLSDYKLFVTLKQNADDHKFKGAWGEEQFLHAVSLLQVSPSKFCICFCFPSCASQAPSISSPLMRSSKCYLMTIINN